MKNKEIKQQETTAQCAICIVMRCAWKWFLAAGLVSLLAILMFAIVWLIIYGNQEHTERWIEIWIGVTLADLMIAGIAALLTYWKEVKQWVCDELRCA